MKQRHTYSSSETQPELYYEKGLSANPSIKKKEEEARIAETRRKTTREMAKTLVKTRSGYPATYGGELDDPKPSRGPYYDAVFVTRTIPDAGYMPLTSTITYIYVLTVGLCLRFPDVDRA